MHDQIFIEELLVKMSVGIYEHEKQNKQNVIINLTLDVETNKDRKLQSISDVVSYEHITNEIIKICQSNHYDLLEELAELIADFCLQDGKVHGISLELKKPDIIDHTKSVGIKIKRQK